MSEIDKVSHARHQLANPLAAVLAEIQLVLMSDAPLDEETRRALQEIERQALRMREILKELK
ncbi:MAG TPA: histidine kinase dimerization/phospho-acceptor domain-containing protein [Gemmatimonadales bacterium]|jgi:signal transduction histidine kinase|nr:histidine kinase dimerization/phospho-acceptor domain-containing protein [Gemmatimonadales bacterium]